MSITQTPAAALEIQSKAFDQITHSFEVLTMPAAPADREIIRRSRERVVQAAYLHWITLDGINLQEGPESFQKFLIDYAGESYGPGLLMCDTVVAALMCWQQMPWPEGQRHLERFLAAVAKGGRVLRRKAKRTPGPEYVFGQKVLGDELRILVNRLQSIRSVRYVELSDALELIDSDREVFFRLYQNREHVANLYASSEKFKNFINGRPGVGPKEMAIALMAAWDGRNEASLANTISRMRKK